MEINLVGSKKQRGRKRLGQKLDDEHRGPGGAGGLRGQCDGVASGSLKCRKRPRSTLSSHWMREPVDHFARRNTRSTDAEIRSSDNGDAQMRIKLSAKFRKEFLPLLSDHGGYFPLARSWLLCRVDHPQTPQTKESADVARGKPRVISSSSRVHELLTFGQVFRLVGLDIDICNPKINNAVRASPCAQRPRIKISPRLSLPLLRKRHFTEFSLFCNGPHDPENSQSVPIQHNSPRPH
jgi:hypothetical protein